MTRTAKIYARIQSQRSGSARHLRYLLDGHGTDGPEVTFWTKGIPKAAATTNGLPTAWATIDRQWRHEKANDGTVAVHSRVTYMQALIALPNGITDTERHSLARQILRLFPQKHPVTIVSHDYGSSGLQNRHFHVVYSYRKHGYKPVDRQLQQTFEKDLKKLLERQYRKYGFKIEENMKPLQIRRKPQSLMRVLLKQHGRERMRNPAYLSSVILPLLKAEADQCRRNYFEDQSAANSAYLNAAESTVAWLLQEIKKAHTQKQPSCVHKRPHRDTSSPFDSLYKPAVKMTLRQRIR